MQCLKFNVALHLVHSQNILKRSRETRFLTEICKENRLNVLLSYAIAREARTHFRTLHLCGSSLLKLARYTIVLYLHRYNVKLLFLHHSLVLVLKDLLQNVVPINVANIC